MAAIPIAMGFTASGIAAGSYAAYFQSVLGGIKAGSLFSVVQSYGATGFFSKIAGLGATASAACYAAYKYEGLSALKGKM